MLFQTFQQNKGILKKKFDGFEKEINLTMTDKNQNEHGF